MFKQKELVNQTVFNNEVTLFGVDPGSRYAGFGVLNLNIKNETIKHINHGVISLVDEKTFAHRLLGLSDILRGLFEKYQPDFIVVEKIFLAKNPQSAFQLGHARGVVMAEAARTRSAQGQGAHIFEYAPRSIKKAMTGQGAATKEDVQWALCRLLGLAQINQIDASDALALAWHQSQVILEQRRMNRASY